MLVAGPVAPIPPRPYRRPLRVQTIKAEIRPTKASRITNIRIISRSSFPLQVKARPAAGLSHLKLRLPRARTCPVTFHGKLMNSAAAGESSLFILDANAVARNHGLMAKTVPYPADPPTEVVPKSTPFEFKVKPAQGIAPSRKSCEEPFPSTRRRAPKAGLTRRLCHSRNKRRQNDASVRIRRSHHSFR